MLVFGTLLPAYRSYKAIKTKNVREYVKWMMYWVIFALFLTCETFADMVLSWLPLYYEVKIIFIIWLLSPATRGSSILYRKFVHPRLVKHEKAIDKYLTEAQKNGYAALLHVGKKGLTAAGDTIIKTAATGQTHLIQTLRRYNSMQDLVGGDSVDSGRRPRQGTWYGGMPPPSIIPTTNRSFDPDDDYEVLQNQYTSAPIPPMPSMPMDESIDYDAQRRGSDLSAVDEQYRYDNPAMPMMSSGENFDATQIPYESQTLPRMRRVKERKPITDAFPDARVTGSGRFSGEGMS